MSSEAKTEDIPKLELTVVPKRFFEYKSEQSRHTAAKLIRICYPSRS